MIFRVGVPLADILVSAKEPCGEQSIPQAWNRKDDTEFVYLATTTDEFNSSGLLQQDSNTSIRA